jgi:ubiquinone/menaquinone biosynthesis C-methylase UbiE
MPKSLHQSAESSLARHRGDYGVDAPYVPLSLGLIGVALLASGVALTRRKSSPRLGAVCIGNGIVFLLSTGGFLYGTRRGKFEVWADILSQLGLRGNETLLDLGCGRGAVLLSAAKLLLGGQAVGVDLWKISDQSGNALAVAERNAQAEGVAGRVALHTADMRDLPFADETFDVVVSNLAIHNITDAAGRAAAIDEAVRVLRPGGRLRIADFRSTHEYARRLQELGMDEVSHRTLGWRSWFGGPWAAMKLVSARKPV